MASDVQPHMKSGKRFFGKKQSMKKQASSFKEWVVWQLRRLSYRWPARSAAFRRAGASRAEFNKKPGVVGLTARTKNFYHCELCAFVYDRKNVSADHIAPVVDPKRGFVDFDTYIRRLFCEADGFQIICKECHDKKTAKERVVRKKYKKVASAR